MSKNTYDSKDIVVLEGLDAVRLRPGMYIGTTGVKGLHHLLWEIVDNSIDEVTNGYGKKIEVKLYNDNSISVEDDGRGVPVSPHPTLKIPGVEVVFTQLHAGGKFNNDNYSYSGGLHGVGASVVNALSKWLNVTINKNNKKYYIEFHSYKNEKGKVVSGALKTPLKEIGTSTHSGTFVRFLPDDEVFGNATFNAETISTRLRELAFLNKGVEIVFINEQTQTTSTFCYEGGISDFCSYLNEGKSTLYSKPIYLTGETNIIKLELAMQHTDSYTENIFSYVNNIPTSEGGTHEVGFKSGLTKVLNDIGKKAGFIKDKDAALIGEDYREGITCVLSIKAHSVQFEGQTKTKLGNPEIKQEVENVIVNTLPEFFDKKENLKILEQIINKAKGACKVREAAKKAKDLTRQKNSVDSYNLVGKLSNCSGRKAELNEIFIVEGDSAGGSAKQARDRSFQAILPLKGKPLNAEKKRIDQVLANEEIKTIISALGTGIGDDLDIENLNYHKIIILADADQDGAHIRAILLTFFFRYMRPLIYNGNIYIGVPPLYKVYKKDKVKYAYTDEDLPKVIEEIGKGYGIQRFKGLGEMNPEQLWETTIDPKNRKLIRVTIDDCAQAEKMVTTLMGDDIDARKEYISIHANFNKDDSFENFV